MKEFTYSEARQHLAALLDLAQREGGVRIRRRDGSVFVLARVDELHSPLDVPAVDIALTHDEILSFIHEGRRFM